ncbi:MAG TPA: S41 family peptidase [Terriglobia bacterium]|nr:S41 family peptidase [Terriglobia bacterium]
MKASHRIAWFFTLSVIVCAVLGGVYGQRVEATIDGGAGSEKAMAENLNAFAKIFTLVEHNYADPVNPDQAIFGPENNNTLGAIPSMLHTLDPHSNFFDAATYARLRETEEGQYYGVGMKIVSVPLKGGQWTTTVTEPMPGSPAFRAGIRPGDLLLKVDGKPTLDLDGEMVAKRLKGPKGTIVQVTVSREGYDSALDFTLTRGQITGLSVDNSFLIRPSVGYVHIASFSETTSDEMTDALKKLGEGDLKGLVLDLRGNPGGVVQTAVGVADHFLDKHQLIVYHRGRNSSERRYFAQGGDGKRTYPIVVIIDHGTASAAEIVTGALQDHDRALVIGETSFGKGLVQTPYNLSEGTGLLLTTAHYYTPSGRLIQRNYDNVSLYDYMYAHVQGPAAHTEVHHTDGGREVFGGGGLSPDVQASEPTYNRVESELVAAGSCPDFLLCGPFYEFSRYYLGIHKTVGRDFQPDDQVVQAFRGYLARQGVMLSDEDVQHNLSFIHEHLREVMVGMLYGEDQALEMTAQNDVLVQKAIESLAQSADLVSRARTYRASRGTNRPAS